MLDEYDFSNAKKNPYAKKLKQQLTSNLETETTECFKEMNAGEGKSVSDPTT